MPLHGKFKARPNGSNMIVLEDKEGASNNGIS